MYAFLFRASEDMCLTKSVRKSLEHGGFSIFQSDERTFQIVGRCEDKWLESLSIHPSSFAGLGRRE